MVQPRVLPSAYWLLQFHLPGSLRPPNGEQLLITLTPARLDWAEALEEGDVCTGPDVSGCTGEI